MVDITIDEQWLKKEETEVEHKLAHLILENVIFCNNGWWYEKEGIPWKKDAVSLHVNVNDTFCYGSDAEDITHDEIHELYEFWRNDEKWGVVVWCMKKRKCKPVPRISNLMIKEGYKLDEILKEEDKKEVEVQIDVAIKENTGTSIELPKKLSVRNKFSLFLAYFKASMNK